MKVDLVLRNAAVTEKPRCDIAICGGTIVAVDEGLDCSGPEYDASGKFVLPGLIDHHIHLLASAAKLDSVDLAGLANEEAVIDQLRKASANTAPDLMIRAIGFDERAFELPNRENLDRWLPQRPLRMQDRTGALWILNSLAIDRLGSGPFPDCVEIDGAGKPTGRIWRGDVWLRGRIGAERPPMAALGRRLTRFGVTGVTDTSPSNGPEEAALFEDLRSSGELPQRLQLMGSEKLPVSQWFHRGPLKLHYDERDLPPLSEIVSRISTARRQHRNVAAHCVTEAELSFFIAALDEAGGARRGDRIEHGSLISAPMIGEIAKRSLAVVTQPAFIHDRGDRYLEQLAEGEIRDLYRLNSLLTAGVAMAAGSDSPYGSLDPWLALQTARDQETAGGRLLPTEEAIDIDTALKLYLLPFDLGCSEYRKVERGAQADLCVVDGGYNGVFQDPHCERVAATLISGRIIYER